MKARINLITIYLLLFTLILGACKKSEDEIPTTISGTISDISKGSGIEATVTLYPGNITLTTKPDGKYEFKISDIDSTYSIKVSATNFKETTQDNIVVTPFQNTTVDIAVSPLYPELSFTSPITGNIWRTETQQTISWTSSDIVGNVKIDLVKGNTITQNIASSITNSGSYTFTFPSSLTSGSDYKIRISNVSNPNIYFESSNFNITTVPPPAVSTQNASNVGSSTATLNGLVNAKGQSTSVSFEYGISTSYGSTKTASQSPVNSSSDVTVNADLSDLTPNTTYHFRVKAENDGGVVYGNDVSFTTSPPSYENINETERNGPTTTLTTVSWSYYREHSTAHKQYFIINGGYSGSYAGYNAASYKNYDWDLFELSLDKNDEVTIEVLKGNTSGLWGMSLNIVLDMTGNTEVGTTPKISGNTYKWTILYNANQVLSDAYLRVSMPVDLVNTGPYNYQLKVTIIKK